MAADIHDAKRTAKMAAMYAAGVTLQAIGDKYGISRERVRQLLTKHHGFRRHSGGLHVAVKRNLEAKAAAKETWCQKKHGCSYAQYLELRSNQKIMRGFVDQRRNAGARGIGWDLKLWEWWTIWRDSGFWEQRGVGNGQYVMCRNGDVGPYAVGNVRIATSSENLREGIEIRRRAKEEAHNSV